MKKEFNEYLKIRDPDGKLNRAQSDWLESAFNSGWRASIKDTKKVQNVPKEAREVLKYFNEKTNRTLRITTKISARLSTFEKEDLIKVIEYAIGSWTGTKYEKHIQLSTLFGSDIKVDKYIGCWYAWRKEKEAEAILMKRAEEDNSGGGFKPSF